MEEQLVLFKTAVLAKEKGFDWECRHVYDEDELKNIPYYDGDGTGVITNNILNNTSTGYEYDVAVPTQSLLQKWLRDKYKLFVSVDCYTYDEPEIFSAILSGYDRKGTFMPVLIDGLTIYDSYEEALEEGLQEALKLI